jgi:prepilin-type N-terminal cleavage/methylation domain-containing protein
MAAIQSQFKTYRKQLAFTLLEMIAVMAIIAILAGALAPSVFDAINRAHAETEEANLEALAESLRRYVLEQKQIPNATTSNWVNAISTVSHFSLNDIEYNAKDFRRRLVFDPQFLTSPDNNFGGFSQNQGLTNAPVSPRAMLISNLTANAASVTNDSTIFNNIWNQTNSPAVVEGPNIKIQRINFADLFYRVILTNQHTNQAYYQLESGTNTAVPAASGGSDGSISRYVLKTTRLSLYSDPYPSGNLEQVHIIHSDWSSRYQTDGSNWSWQKP